MKYICAVICSSLITMPAYAKLVDLYVKNESATTIVIEKKDGSRVTLPPQTRISSSFFENYSEVKNYVDGKYICTWYINAHPDSNLEMDGIGYANPYGDKWECVSYFLQGPGVKAGV